MKLHIATAPRRDSSKWKQQEIDLDEFLEWFENPANKKEAGNYILGQLNGDQRSKRTILSRDAITLDADDTADPNLPDIMDLTFPYFAVVHTTFSSTKTAPRFRVIVPTSRALTPDEYAYAAEQLADMLGGLQHFDKGSLEPERYMFRPAAQNPEEYEWRVIPNPIAPADEFLLGFDPDLSSLQDPFRTRKRDPTTLQGPAGAFNRVYSFQEAIDEYNLPYTPAGPGRWTLSGAKTLAGLSQISDAFVFSHHITDPAYGQTCSAFDLVRIHLFGHEDEQATPGTTINNLPSYLRMSELALLDEKVRAEIGADFAPYDDEQDGKDTKSWVKDLQLSPSNGKVRDTVHNWDLISENDPIAKSLRYNEFTMALETQKDLPWRSLDQGGPVFEKYDIDKFGDYIERAYGIRPPDRRAERVANDAGHRNWYSPIREYLESLEWDGVPRVEECLPGVRPTEYTRLVARKSLVAAVARALDPGVKWDHALVLYGKENQGKSYWIDKMAKGRSAPVGKLENKDTLIALHRCWIGVADESFAFRRADNDVMKEFITRRVDVFRLPYDRTASERPRKFVIWATTNDEYFLRPQEGNRRFLIVHSETRVDFDKLTDEYVDQVWAEAVAMYRSGERLFLDVPESALAERERERYTEEEQYRGVVEEFIADKDRVSVIQLWVEAIGGPLDRKDPKVMKTLREIMKGTPDWVENPVSQPTTSYGHQIVFVRQGPSAEWPEDSIPGEDLL